MRADAGGRGTLYMAVITAKRSNPVIKALARGLAAQGRPFKVVTATRTRKRLTIPATGST
jgi:hypothetical protein